MSRREQNSFLNLRWWRRRRRSYAADEVETVELEARRRSTADVRE